MQCLILSSCFFNAEIIVPEPVIDEGCKRDGDCPSKEACFSGICKNPCLEIRPCVANAICKVYDTLPRRTMTCSCKIGYTGKGDVRCDKISMFLLHFLLITI